MNLTIETPDNERPIIVISFKVISERNDFTATVMFISPFNKLLHSLDPNEFNVFVGSMLLELTRALKKCYNQRGSNTSSEERTEVE